MTILVKVVRAPGFVKEVAIPTGGTVSDALNAADTSLSSGEKATVGGIKVETSRVLADGDRVIMAAEAKGN